MLLATRLCTRMAWNPVNNRHVCRPSLVPALRDDRFSAVSETELPERIPMDGSDEYMEASTSNRLLFDKFVVPWDAVTAVITTVQLFCLQIALGFGATPVLGNAFTQTLELISSSESAPAGLGAALGAVTSQLVFLYIVSGVVSKAEKRSNEELASLGLQQVAPTSAYRLDVESIATAAAVSVVALGAGFLVSYVQAPDHVQSAVEMTGLLQGGNQGTAVALALATGVLAPVVEEKVYRGFVLGSLLSPICHLRVNVHLAVRCCTGHMQNLSCSFGECVQRWLSCPTNACFWPIYC